MGRTRKNIKFRIPEKPRKIKGFRNGGFPIATMISSQPRYDHFDTSPKTAVPLFLKTVVFPRLRSDNGIIISQNSGICKSKIKKFFIQGKKCCGGYIRGGEGAAERKHLTKAALCDIIMS